MKLLLVLLFSTSLYASKEMKAEKFEDKKKMALERIDQRLKNLADSKTCISAAADMKGLKACRQKEKEMRKANKAKFKELRDAKRAEWKGKRDKMKAKKAEAKKIETH